MPDSPINFRYFPATTWRVPGFYGEFDASQANTALPVQRALIIGQMLAAGTATPGVAVEGFSQSQVNMLCGATSMLAAMYAAFRLQDAYGEVWLLPVADDGSGTAAVKTITFTGPATATGTLSLYVMGTLIPVGVTAGDTAPVIAGNVTIAILAAGLPVAAANPGSASTVTVTALHKGAAMNDIDIRLNYRANRNGEVTPAGVGFTVASTTTGAINPQLGTALANLGNKTFDFIALPYNDSGSYTALQAFLSDQSGRWSAVEMLYGHVFAAYRGTLSARTTFGIAINNQHFSILGFFDSPTPEWLEAADWAGAHATILRTNPALGVVGQPLNLLPPPVLNQDTPAEMNVLLYDGMSTFTVDEAGQCRIGRSITTYKQNAAGVIDDSYLNTNLLFQAMFAARYIQAQLLTQFQNKILVVDGTPIGAGSPATTPSLVFDAACALYGYLCSQFVCQNPAAFARNGYARKGQKGQVILYLPIDFSDQVIQIAALIQFHQST